MKLVISYLLSISLLCLPLSGQQRRWIPKIVAGVYTANRVTFAGDGQCRLERDADLTGSADGIEGTFSCWYTPATDGSEQWILLNETFHVAIGRNNSNNFYGRVQSSGGTTLAQTSSTVTLVAAGGRKHLFFSWKIASAGGWIKIYIDRVDRSNVITEPTTDTSVDYTDTDWGVGDLPGGYNPVNGELSELYFNIATALDPATSSNLDKFVTAGLAPVDLGATGSIPTGTAPIIYLKTAGTGFTANSGTGGNFVKKGTTALVDSGTFP
jgi:hypothetical protein